MLVVVAGNVEEDQVVKIVLFVGMSPVAGSEGIGGDQMEQMAALGGKKLVA